MTLLADARVLLAMARGAAHTGSHAQRLQRLYAPQAKHYDAFRERLLHGREELIESLPVADGGYAVELGAGTGRNLEFFGDRLARLRRVDVVDLCPALLEVARDRAAKWPNVSVVEADASVYRPHRLVDLVYFSYSLTMMPDWRAALDNALAMLVPGGALGVVDFHLPAFDRDGRRSPRARAHRLWRSWFEHDGVHLSDRHLPWLCEQLIPRLCMQRTGAVPYLPWLRAPYYLFVGSKRHQ